MALIASTVLALCRSAYLNDPSGAIYPDVTMYPVMQTAYKELQTKLSGMGIGSTKEIFPAITVPAGTIALVDGGLLPTDLISPMTISERQSGATTPYLDMDERDWEPDITIDTRLNFWAWREDEIKFPGATTDRQILIHGIKGYTAITGINSPIQILNCDVWLAKRTAAIAALTIGGNAVRAKALNEDLVTDWDDFKQGVTKRKQAIPVRRRRTRYRQD